MLQPILNHASNLARVTASMLKSISGIALLVMLVVSLSDVIARYAINSPIYGAAEIIAHLLGLIVFTALPVVSATRQHITVDLFEMAIPEKFVSVINRILDLVSAAALFLIAYSVFWLAIDFKQIGDVSTELSVPNHIVAYGVSAFSGIAALSLAARAIAFPDKTNNLVTQEGPNQ